MTTRRRATRPCAVSFPPLMHPLKEDARRFFEQLQDELCRELERLDGPGRFRAEAWTHSSGGGGTARVLEGGGVFEKGGVNVSAVTSRLTERLAVGFARTGVAADVQERLLEFTRGTPQFFVAVSLAASRLMLEAGHGVDPDERAAPAEVTDAQLRELGIKLRKPKEQP